MYSDASLNNSACLRREMAGACHAPVRGFLCGRNGFRAVFDSVAECAVPASEGDSETVVDAAPTLGSDEDVVDVVVTVSVDVCAGLLCAVAIRDVADIWGGGNLVKNRSKRGCSCCAS